MCCFTAKTEVHGTTIFARLKGADTQSLAYQMQYTATEPVAMILPLPVALPAREDSVSWVNLKDYPDLFADLSRGFPHKPESSFLGSRSKSAATAVASPLEVHDVGDFIASFVPSVDDFARLDPRFSIKKEIWAQIPEYVDYGFAVFQLKSTSGTTHPIAFEWKTRLRGQVFFPTVHIHDGTVHKEESFDHALYLQDSDLDAKVGDYDGPEAKDSRTGLTRSEGKASSFANVARSLGLVDGALLVHRMTIQGRHPNKDTLVSPRAIAAAGGCGRCDYAAAEAPTGLGVGATVLAGLAWIIRRRDERSPR
jgi:hypothetical protein